MNRLIRQIEKNIKDKMAKIQSGEITPAQSNIGSQLNKLKELDEPSYENFIQQYKEILKK